ncbi:HprK-related kinase A [Acidovorax sp. JG5]|uniref:HprK-related kinase A n=1 Tax=Acidovorax sp. JG5 TaxID=2822718 RepID=UPI001B32A5CB|nr:HprK-related kinase A [Acidovorax sp. JG5]
MSTQGLLSSLSRSQLDRLLGGEGLGIVVPPFVVRVRSPISVVADGLERLYSDHPLATQDGAVFYDFHVAVEVRRTWFRPQCIFALDGRQPFTPLALGEAFALFEWGLNWCVTSHCHQWISLHAAVLERGGRAVVLPAPPGAGKSTLCAALMLHGWRLLSDELTLLEPVSGLVVPSPRPISLKNASIDVIRERNPGCVLGPVARDTQKGTVAHLKVLPENLARANERALPAWVVFPRYERGAALQVQPRAKATTVVELARNSFNQHVHGRAGFKALVRLADACDSFDLRYSQLDQALAWFDALEPPSPARFA